MKKNKVFLDDVRNPYCVFKNTILPIYEHDEDWVIIRSYDDFVSYLNNNDIPEVVSFDHDLSYDAYLPQNQEGEIDYDSLEEKTGYDAAKILVEYCLNKGVDIPMYYVHSANPVGAENIKYYLENAKKHLV